MLEQPQPRPVQLPPPQRCRLIDRPSLGRFVAVNEFLQLFQGVREPHGVRLPGRVLVPAPLDLSPGHRDLDPEPLIGAGLVREHRGADTAAGQQLNLPPGSGHAARLIGHDGNRQGGEFAGLGGAGHVHSLGWWPDHATRSQCTAWAGGDPGARSAGDAGGLADRGAVLAEHGHLSLGIGHGHQTTQRGKALQVNG